MWRSKLGAKSLFPLELAGVEAGAEASAASVAPASRQCGCLVTPALSPTGGHFTARTGISVDSSEAFEFDADVFFAEAARASAEGLWQEADRLRLEAIRREWLVFA